MITKPLLSVIIPLYNESSRLKNLAKVYKFFDGKKFKYEVILINDGSTDNTLQRIIKLSEKFKFTHITYPRNRGKGFAVKKGMLAAKGHYLLFTDIDLSTPIEEFSKLEPLLQKNTLIIGSRKTKGSKLKKRQGFLRENLGKGFTLLSKLVLKLNLSDFTCGFKCFPRSAAKEIFTKQKIEGWGFDPEVLFLGKKYGYKIIEIPVKWSNDPETKVRFPRDIIRSVIDIYKIKYNALRNFYKLPRT